MSVAVLITPARGWAGVSSPRRAPLTILFCVWSRVRTTSCGYVVIEATIFDAAEQARNCLGVRSSDERRPGTTGREHMLMTDVGGGTHARRSSTVHIVGTVHRRAGSLTDWAIILGKRHASLRSGIWSEPRLLCVGTSSPQKVVSTGGNCRFARSYPRTKPAHHETCLDNPEGIRTYGTCCSRCHC